MTPLVLPQAAWGVQIAIIVSEIAIATGAVWIYQLSQVIVYRQETLCVSPDLRSTSSSLILSDFSLLRLRKRRVSTSDAHVLVTSAGFVGYRRRCCFTGWSPKSVWRTWRGRWSCLPWGRESPALPATLATTTATTPPVCPAPLEPTQTAPTVNKPTPGYHGDTFVLTMIYLPSCVHICLYIMYLWPCVDCFHRY